MSDTMPPSATPHIPANPPMQSRSILGRLAGAVRRQDWFTVAVEVLIVVLGVVIGFQVTAWGQARSDRATEQAYLRQLAADLRETERQVAWADSILAPTDRSGTELVRAYYRPEPPPRDSLLGWLSNTYWMAVAIPVVSTAEALVATGDLGLIRDDTLRSAITAYLEAMRDQQVNQKDLSDRFAAAAEPLFDRIDLALLRTEITGPAVVDSLARANPYYGLPEGPRRPLQPVDLRALLADDGTRALLRRMNLMKENLKWVRENIAEETAALLRRVEAQTDR